jgi:tetratricopeptide (TPR) repeat protein
MSKPEIKPLVGAAKSAIDASLITRAVDVLVSPQSSHQQRRDVLKQLSESGKLDLAITELEQRMASNPQAAEYPAALGQAYLQKCKTVKDVREQGILAMQADKVFDTALSLDPANWEARFTKAVAMSYWPPMLNKGDEVIQHFQTLIEQQEAQAPQPNFADTYTWLGDQYQKAGRTNDALAVWQRGAGMYPADERLRQKIAGTP